MTITICSPASGRGRRCRIVCENIYYIVCRVQFNRLNLDYNYTRLMVFMQNIFSLISHYHHYHTFAHPIDNALPIRNCPRDADSFDRLKFSNFISIAMQLCGRRTRNASHRIAKRGVAERIVCMVGESHRVHCERSCRN